MKKFFFLIACVIGMAPAFSQSLVEGTNAAQSALIARYAKLRDSLTVPVFPVKMVDYSIVGIEFSGAVDKSITIPKKYKPFNPKKDNIGDVVVKKTDKGNYELYVLHHNGTVCDMNEFNIRIEGENLNGVLKETVMEYSIPGTIWDYIDGTYPFDGSIVITHRESDLSTTLHYTFKLLDGTYFWRGLDGAFVFDALPSNTFDGYYSLMNLKNGHLYVMKGPVTLDASGRDGKNGRNGANGVNGVNQYSYTDKNGRVHTIYGTYGTPGYNGENGGNGEAGGNVFVFVGRGIPGKMLTVNYGGGTGGKGGRGGIGGAHGRGTALFGSRAANGRNGVDGQNGRVGSVQFHYLTTINNNKSGFYQQKSRWRAFPAIQVDLSEKEKKGGAKKNKNPQPTDNSVEF